LRQGRYSPDFHAVIFASFPLRQSGLPPSTNREYGVS
jgi:hypothetical protein